MSEATGLLPTPDQVGMFVKDREAAMRQYGPLFGPFHLMESTIDGADFRGKPSSFSQKIAFGKSGEFEIEFIEWTAADPQLQAYIDALPPGLHHLRYRVDDYQGWLNKLAGQGYRPILSKTFSDGTAFAYLDRPGDPLVIEILQMAGGYGDREPGLT